MQTPPVPTTNEGPPTYLLPPHGSPRRPGLSGRVRVLLLGLLAVALWVGGDFAFVTIGAEVDHAAPADTIIVLGCGDPYGEGGLPSDCIRARAEHAAELYREGLAPHVIASGGSADGGPVEAAALAEALAEGGVPGEAIVQEGESRNTIQNMEYSGAIMRQHNWHTAILVTEPYHINRAALIARDDGLQVYPSPAVNSPLWTDPKLRLLKLGRDTFSLILYQLKAIAGARE